MREMRLKELGIKGYFQKVMFVDEKSKRIFEEIAGNTEKVMVVGDSIADEIKIGNQLGFVTVRLKKGRFAVKIPKDNDEMANFEITDIQDLENILLHYER